jgi:DNA-binding SARP family transcriptional activator
MRTAISALRRVGAAMAGSSSTMPVLAMPAALPTPSGGRWCLQLLGVPCLVRTGSPQMVRLSAKDAALLAVVALDGPVPPEHAAALIWPAVDHRKADTNLRQRLFRMRRDLGANLVNGGALLRLAPEVETNLAATLARIASDENAGRDELLGTLQFEDLPELARWLHAARTRWHEQRDAALAGAAAQCESSGAIARGLVYAQRLVDSDSLSEHAQRRLMRLHYLRGDCSAAIASFESFEQRLKDELGARPSAETIELLETIERSAKALPVRRAVVPASLVRPPRLVGRSADLAALARAWSERRVFALLGEAGIGKSRLLHDFAAGYDGVLIVRARPGDAGIAYTVLSRLLRAVLARHPIELIDGRREEMALVLPELGNPVALAGEAQRLLLHRAVDATLAEATRLGLGAIVVDDLQLADDASIEFLQSLTQSESLAALHWGFAQRPAEGGAAALSLRAALADAQHLEAIALAPLNLAQMVELIESLALSELDADRLAPALLRHTGGNPLFALETLKDMMLSGSPAADDRLPQPATVAALVERRLLQLSPAALKLARAAALAGASFSAELAAAVLELHPLDIAEPWRELEVAQVIRDGAFAHDLIFEATRASVPAPIAQLLHRRIAAQLQARNASPASIAPHWAGAHEWSLAGEAHMLAARQAQGASQRGHEVEHWRHARDCFERAGDQARSFDARCESVQALIVVHGVGHASTVIDALLGQARSDPQRVAALTARAFAALMAVDHRAGVAAAVEAGALARSFASPWPWLEAERLHAVGLAQGGRASEALAVIEPLRAQVERDGNVEQRGRFWSDYAYVLNTARHLRDAAIALGHAIVHAQSQGDLAELATLTSNLATVKGNLGHVDEALELAQRSLAVQVQLGTTEGPGGGVVETYVALYCGMAGRYREALARLDAAVDRFRRDGQTLWIAVASNHKAQFLIELGQLARARQALDYEAPPVDSVRARGATLAARIERALGKKGEAELRHALALLAEGGDPHVRMHALLEEAVRLEPLAAVARCEEVSRLAGELEFVGVAMKADLLSAQFALHADPSGAGAALMRELSARLEKAQPADMYLPEAWWIAVRVFDACGASEQALAALAQGTRWIQATLPHVPDEFRDSFLHRNPTNLALLAAARRRLA